MSNPAPSAPRWAQLRARAIEADEDFPDIGGEPTFVPRLITRLLPFRPHYAISALTLSDVLQITQRILNGISYEVVYGTSSDIIDRRSLSQDVLQLARLAVEPFEEGSFVLPGTLTGDVVEVNGVQFTGSLVLERFLEVMEAIQSRRQSVPASITILQDVEDLGRITRREADIEYAPLWHAGTSWRSARILVNNDFVAQAAQVCRDRIDPQREHGSVEGILTAIDIRRATLALTIDKSTVVRGSFSEFARQTLLQALNKRVRLSGLVTYERRSLRHVHALIAEVID